MECLHPLKLINSRKFFSLDYADNYVNYVRCGKCANCQETLSKEWYFRAYYEYRDTVQNGGYMIMDCLTYAEKYVPRVSRYIPKLPRNLNFYCFDYTDVRYFLVRLRRYLTKRGYDVKDSLRYFFSTEYGTDDRYTHRPHIHILFYVTTPNLDNYTLSRAISKCWHYGYTDGLPRKSRSYVDGNTIRGSEISAVRSCKYVSKYVMKDSVFQKVIDERIYKILCHIYKYRQSNLYAKYFPNMDLDKLTFDQWQKTELGKKFRRDLVRYCNQFHRQSLGFGASYLDNANISEIMETNIITIPDGKKVVNRIGLPMYFKRKLFYDLKQIDGLKYWQPNELGKEYLEKRYRDRMRQLTDEYTEVRRNFGIDLPVTDLVEYCMNKRGRIIAEKPSDNLQQVINSDNLLFNYVTSSDKIRFGFAFLTDHYKGYADNYEDVANRVDIMSPNDFIEQNVYFNNDLETLLDQLEGEKALISPKIQTLFDNKQRLNQIYKNLFPSRV